MSVISIVISVLQITCMYTGELHKHKSQPKGLCPKPDFLWVPGSQSWVSVHCKLAEKAGHGYKGPPWNNNHHFWNTQWGWSGLIWLLGSQARASHSTWLEELDLPPQDLHRGVLCRGGERTALFLRQHLPGEAKKVPPPRASPLLIKQDYRILVVRYLIVFVFYNLRTVDIFSYIIWQQSCMLYA